MKKIVTLFAAVLCGLALNAKTLYLNPGVWETADAKFALYYFNDGSEGVWGDYMTKNGSVYQGELPDGYGKVIFVRLNPAGAKEWTGMWNQTEDLAVPDKENQFNITCWDCASDGKSGGNWSEYDGQGGGPVDPQPGGAKDYYLKGYRGPSQGDITTPTPEELFEGGILENYAFEGDANGLGYFFVLVCEPGTTVGDCFMAAAYATGHCTLQKEDGSHKEKLGVPAPSATFYLYDNGDGTLELSIEQLPGKTLVGGGQGIENTLVNAKAHKTIIDGQLRIIRGDKMFDATGRQL